MLSLLARSLHTFVFRLRSRSLVAAAVQRVAKRICILVFTIYSSRVLGAAGTRNRVKRDIVHGQFSKSQTRTYIFILFILFHLAKLTLFRIYSYVRFFTWF